MVTTKPIKIDDEVKETLDDMKKHPRETYNDTLRRILKLNHVKEKK
jgi:predicted CopG family antitoxin